jgi:hypothetical protein
MEDQHPFMTNDKGPATCTRCRVRVPTSHGFVTAKGPEGGLELVCSSCFIRRKKRPLYRRREPHEYFDHVRGVRAQIAVHKSFYPGFDAEALEAWVLAKDDSFIRWAALQPVADLNRLRRNERPGAVPPTLRTLEQRADRHREFFPAFGVPGFLAWFRGLPEDQQAQMQSQPISRLIWLREQLQEGALTGPDNRPPAEPIGPYTPKKTRRPRFVDDPDDGPTRPRHIIPFPGKARGA